MTGDDDLKKLARRAIAHSVDDRSEAERSQEAKASFVTLLALLVGWDKTQNPITYNDFFDAVARKYSDHYVDSRAAKVRDMLPTRAKNVHRDLVNNFIDINKLWNFFIQDWPRKGAPAEPRFSLAVSATVTQSNADAVRLYRLAADGGDAVAQVNLGYCYATGGGGLAKNDREAARLFKLSANQGNAAAQVNLGYCYATGTGCVLNDREAARLFELAADHGHPAGWNNLGCFRAVGRGRPEQNSSEAARLFKLAADQGNAAAQVNLGVFYATGHGGLAKNDREAARLFKLAADQGDAAGRLNLGLFYEKGRGGLAKDTEEAARLFKLAADQGDAAGQLNLGLFYEKGRGGLPKDDREAESLFRLAADQGHPAGQVKLAGFYKEGHGGLKKDSKEARRLYGLAAAHGNPFYSIEEMKIAVVEEDNGAQQRRVKTNYVARPKSGEDVTAFRNLVRSHGLLYRRGIRLALHDDQQADPPAEDAEVRELKRANVRYCAEAPYNEVWLGEQSTHLLGLQSKVRLIFDAEAFTRDFDRVFQKREELEKQLEDADVDPSLSNTPRKLMRKDPNAKGHNKRKEEEFWSVRDAEVYYRSMELGIADSTPPTPEVTRMAAEKLAKKPAVWHARGDNFIKWLEKRVKNRKTLPEILEAARGLTTQQLAEAAVAMWSWRENVRAQLTRHDQAQSFVQMYRAVYEQLKERAGELPTPLLIRSDFYRTINRRYQPTHMWPSYVSNRKLNQELTRAVAQPDDQLDNAEIDDDVDADPEQEETAKTYRKNWFKGQHPKTGQPCRLVGIDVSSSQTQIVATFLSSARLEQDTMDNEDSEPFKQTLAKIAWDRHNDPDDDFELKVPKSPTPATSGYSGPGDSHLQDLCKALWMTVSYGGTIRGVVRAQDNDPMTYGLGWRPESASLFLESINDRYPSMQAFLSACRDIAESIADDSKVNTKGFVFKDPFDRSENRWNPVARKDRHLDIGKGKLTLSLPRGLTIRDTFAENAQYAVDKGALRRMLAPCLIHMLDAYYSSLVMQGLEKRNITTFVAIHDCWLVPQIVIDKGQECDGADVIKEVFNEAAAEWYRGLRPAYEALLRYLPEPRRDPKKRRHKKRRRQMPLPLESLIESQLAETDSDRSQLVVRLGYKDITRGLRSLSRLCAGELDTYSDLVAKLPAALQLKAEAIERAVVESRHALDEREPSRDQEKDRTLRRHRRLITEAFDHWRQRMRGGYVPRFLFKPD